MSKHTRGPWTDQSVDGSQWGIYGPNGESIGMAHQIRPIPDDLKQVERTANARLMAASPELLEMLIECVEDSQSAVDQYVLNYGENWRPARLAALRARVEKARAAIKKATGEQP